MKTKTSLVIAAIYCLHAWAIASETGSPQSPPTGPSAEAPTNPVAAPSSDSRPAAAPADSTSQKEKPAAGTTDSPAKLSPALAAKRAAEEAKRAHILPASGPFKMETPPPAPRAETKTPPPAAGYTWMPGHWMPVKGEWKWMPGEWGVPPTAASVWIEGKYDSKTKEWTAGYWQPDRAESYEPNVLEKESATPPKY